jgi:hypothetical protein
MASTHPPAFAGSPYVGPSASIESVVSRAESQTRTAPVPWYLWCGVLAITSSTIGGIWDVSWHRSIGRDTFWTPAHMLIYACGVLAALICGYLIFATTFGHSARLRDVSVNILGFRAPLGAFIAAWGGIAMLTSAPFDNWWHAAYGLDVKIISPPHTLLIFGIRAVAIGVLFLLLAAMNRSAATDHAGFKTLQRLFLYCGGLIIGGQMFFLLEYTWDVKLHSVDAYIAMAIALPVVFAALSQAAQYRWTATTTATIYTLIGIAEVLILPLFPATPKLGPVFYPVTHMVPAKFPILILVPAIALDLLWQRTRSWKVWQVALASGAIFVAVLVAVEWPFASFLLSKASENRLFGTIYFQFSSSPGNYDRLRLFFQPTHGFDLFRGLFFAALYGSIGTWIGLRFGQWMRSVQR